MRRPGLIAWPAVDPASEDDDDDADCDDSF
jgi:hypothetical protein